MPVAENFLSPQILLLGYSDMDWIPMPVIVSGLALCSSCNAAFAVRRCAKQHWLLMTSKPWCGQPFWLQQQTCLDSGCMASAIANYLHGATVVIIAIHPSMFCMATLIDPTINIIA